MPASGVPATNFSVAAGQARHPAPEQRRRHVSRAGRSDPGGVGRNEPYGVDGTFAFFDNLAVQHLLGARRASDGRDATRGRRTPAIACRWITPAIATASSSSASIVGEQFKPEVGFVRRADMRRHFGLARFSPRPRASKVGAQVFWTASMAYIENGAGPARRRATADADFAVEFQNSDRFSVGYARHLRVPARSRSASRPASSCRSAATTYASVRAGYNLGQQRRASANLSFEHGTFYDGHKTTLGISRGRLNLTPQLSIEPSFSVNWVDLVEGSFTTQLVGSRVTYTMTPRMFVSALLQYNSGQQRAGRQRAPALGISAGQRAVRRVQRAAGHAGPRFPALANRALIVKINRLFRF